MTLGMALAVAGFIVLLVGVIGGGIAWFQNRGAATGTPQAAHRRSALQMMAYTAIAFAILFGLGTFTPLAEIPIEADQAE
jgi:uncharacterized iron-regulated membrane protein